MAYAVHHSGSLILPDRPAIVCEGFPHDSVPLDEWIRCTKESPFLREVLHPDSRPNAFFKSSNGDEVEFVYFFGRVSTQKWEDRGRVDIMEELAAHLNEFTNRI